MTTLTEDQIAYVVKHKIHNTAPRLAVYDVAPQIVISIRKNHW